MTAGAMTYRPLGTTGLKVSVLCLGTMTFGKQNSEAEAHAQLDYARDQGINFIDTAELYPVPRGPATYGRTEEIIGNWLKSHRERGQIVLATKIAGPGVNPPIRPGLERLDKRNIIAAVDASLRRLQTDYIDLYQLHWPDREANFFGRLGFNAVADSAETVALAETFEALATVVAAGKVRHIGVSNETPWGVMRFLALADALGGPRLQTIQNPYSLLNRSFEVGLAEVALREKVGLLAYSPLGMGTLTGKYLRGARPEGARLSLFSEFQRYLTPSGQAAAEKYVMLARAHGLKPEQMALAYVTSRAFTTATIVGATSVAQLQTNIASLALRLSPALLEEIEQIHREHTNPCP